jgi:hypothetical protein
MRKNGAKNPQTIKRVAPVILSLVQAAFNDRSLKGIRFTRALSFERHIETIFKLHNAQFGTSSCLILYVFRRADLRTKAFTFQRLKFAKTLKNF